jgi:hypothetical protein
LRIVFTFASACRAHVSALARSAANNGPEEAKRRPLPEHLPIKRTNELNSQEAKLLIYPYPPATSRPRFAPRNGLCSKASRVIAPPVRVAPHQIPLLDFCEGHCCTN